MTIGAWGAWAALWAFVIIEAALFQHLGPAVALSAAQWTGVVAFAVCALMLWLRRQEWAFTRLALYELAMLLVRVALAVGLIAVLVYASMQSTPGPT